MLILAKDKGLWGDYTTIFQFSQYFHHPIYVWNKFNGQIMANVQNEFQIEMFPKKTYLL
jgi:hypothetical protein